MRIQQVLHVARVELVAAAIDHVLRAPGDGDIPVRIHGGEVAGAVPGARRKRGGISRLVVEEPGKRETSAHLQFAFLAAYAFRVARQGHAHLGPRTRTPGAVGRHFEGIPRPRVEGCLRLGHAPELRHRATGQPRREPTHQLRRARAARHDRQLQRRKIVLVEQAERAARSHVRRRSPQRSGTVALHGLCEVRGRKGGQQHGRRAHGPADVQRVQPEEV